MARHGTTTLEAKTGCGPNDSAEMKVLRVVNVLNKGALDIVPTYLFRAGTAEDAEHVFADLLFHIRRRRLARFADLQWDTDMARRPLLVRFLDAARSLGFPCKIHADQHSCGGAVSLAAEYGATSIDHLEYATLDQARVLASVETVATLLPCASFRHGHHAPARTLFDAGVPIALGTNFNSWHTASLRADAEITSQCSGCRCGTETGLRADPGGTPDSSERCALRARLERFAGRRFVDKDQQVVSLGRAHSKQPDTRSQLGVAATDLP
jgi:imidazolonepropionase